MQQLLPVLAGAAFGTIATFIVEQMRFSRTIRHEAQANHLAIYFDFIKKMMSTYNTIFDIAANDDRSSDRGLYRLREIVIATGTYDAFLVVELTGPHDLVHICHSSWEVMREFRDTVGEGHTYGSPEFAAVDRRMRASLHEAKKAVRRVQGLKDDIDPSPELDYSASAPFSRGPSSRREIS